MERDSGGAPLRILLVEDDRSVLRMLRFSLHTAGFEIIEAHTGEEALGLLAERQPEAVILDLGLPDGRSGAVLEQLGQLERSLDRPPVWVATSAQDRDVVTQRYGPLRQRFIPKPFDPWELISYLESQLASRHQSPG
ncbi:MAG: two-component system response regulator [Dehalococcoidia bacterium]